MVSDLDVVNMKQVMGYTIDLTKLEEEGDFLCPKCGTHISSDDETEDVYQILETKVRNDVLENLTIQCKNCSNKILLTGLSDHEL